MPSFDARVLAAFGARFLVLYLLFFALGLGLSLFHAADTAIVAAAQRQLATLEEPEIRRHFRVEDDGSLVQRVSTSRVRSAELKAHGDGFVSHNLFLFAALVLAWPGLAGRVRLWALGLGGVAIFALDVLIVMSVVWKADRLYLANAHPEISSGMLAHAAHVVGALHPTGGFFMLPVFLFGLTLVAAPGLAGREVAARAGRNEPCPCGSGRKFKRCCGA